MNTELSRPLEPKPMTALFPSSDWLEDFLGSLIPNPGMKSRFYRLACAGRLCPYSPTLEGVGFYKPLKPGFWTDSPRGNRTGRLPLGQRLAQPLGTLGQEYELIRFNPCILLEKWRGLLIFPPFHESDRTESPIKLSRRGLASGLDLRQKVFLPWNGLISNNGRLSSPLTRLTSRRFRSLKGNAQE